MKNCLREKGVEVHHTSTPNEGENQSPQEKKEDTQTHALILKRSKTTKRISNQARLWNTTVCVQGLLKNRH
jgi:hypothetical protein